MKKHLTEIEKNLKGCGMDKDVDMATMEKKNKVIREVRKNPAHKK